MGKPSTQPHRGLEEVEMEAVSTIVTSLIMVGVPAYLIGAMAWSIRNERRRSNLRKVWKHFGLSIALSILFLVSWLGQGLSDSEWQLFVDERRAHQEPVKAVDYVVHLAQSTTENWQSEFLQLFAFVVLAALLIHRGSAESKDGDERMEQALRRIESRLDELTPSRRRS